MKIAVIGAGGVGGYFGGRLALAGNDVTFLARGAHLEAMRASGLTVRSVKGDFRIDSVKATDIIGAIGKPDMVLVCLKAWQVKDAAAALRPALSDATVILPLQNGVMATQEIRESITHGEVFGGLCRIFSRIEAPGVIDHFGSEPEIVFGRTDNAVTEKVRRINALFSEAGISSVIAGDITAETWKKFIGICVSGLMAVMHSTYGEIREVPESRRMMVALINEVYRLAIAAGVNIEEGYVDRLEAVIDTYPYGSTSSLARDVWDGRPSEIEYQNGTVVRLAGAYGLSVPVNEYVYSCILPRERRARREL